MAEAHGLGLEITGLSIKAERIGSENIGCRMDE
jgi:hypothetical protein